MSIKVGVDLVYIPKFKKTVERSGDTFLKRVFHPSELTNRDNPHLAGIQIGYGKSGRPKVGIPNEEIASKIEQLDVSISHDGEYAIAFVTVVLKQMIDTISI